MGQFDLKKDAKMCPQVSTLMVLDRGTQHLTY
jgi:hypothetical protein